MKTVFWFVTWFHRPKTDCRVAKCKESIQRLDLFRIFMLVLSISGAVILALYSYWLFEDSDYTMIAFISIVIVVWLVGMYEASEYRAAKEYSDKNVIDLTAKFPKALSEIRQHDVRLFLFWVSLVAAIIALIV